MKSFDINSARGALLHVCDAIIVAEPLLTEIDSRIGDGDHGQGMKAGFTALKAMLQNADFADMYTLFRESGIALLKEMGGASGVIFCTLFIGGVEPLRGVKEMDGEALIRFLRAGKDSVMRRGGAVAGQKTMLDALLPAVEAMSGIDSQDIGTLLNAAAEGAQAGAEATKAMSGAIGRSQHFAREAIGTPDPGAVSTAIIFEALSQAASAV